VDFTHLPLCVLLCVTGLLVGGQNAPAAGAASTDVPTLPFRSLEELERHEVFSEIRQRLLAEQVEQDQRRRDFSQLSQELRERKLLTDDDRRVLQCLLIRRHIQQIAKELKQDYAKRMSINDAIKAALRKGMSNENSLVFLRKAKQVCEELLQEVVGQNKLLEKQLRDLDIYMRKIPPPVEFTNMVGMKMILTKGRQGAFYVSATPISQATYSRVSTKNQIGDAATKLSSYPRTGISRTESTAFCKRLSQIDGYHYQLPLKKQTPALSEQVGAMSVASWLQDTWQWEDPEKQYMSRRFGVSMATIWDQNSCLSTSVLFPELPFAHYENLGILVVTSPRTGRMARIRSLKGQLK